MATLDTLHLDACLDLAESQDSLGKLVKEALDIIYDTLETYGNDRVSVSFNGGKDCTVLLHLYAAALHRRRLGSNGTHAMSLSTESSPPTSVPDQSSTFNLQPIPSIYISPPSPFPQLETFITESERRYNLSLYRVTPPAAEGAVEKGGEGMRRALEVYKAEFPHIEAILVGTRRGDPHGAKLAHKNPTDAGWPRFMRVHPVIDWSYTDVWDFLRRLNVPYCDLYDAGYTSLGSTYNTSPNPALYQPKQGHGGDGTQEVYLPAYKLTDEGLERAGRGSSSTTQVPSSVLPSPAVELDDPVMSTKV